MIPPPVSFPPRETRARGAGTGGPWGRHGGAGGPVGLAMGPGGARGAPGLADEDSPLTVLATVFVPQNQLARLPYGAGSTTV